MNNTQLELARILENVRDNLEEISERLDSLEGSDLESEIDGLRSEIRDVDSRLDSMTN
jgi:predicted nuclease with TOPRIM domain